jgi:hypothetical protein
MSLRGEAFALPDEAIPDFLKMFQFKRRLLRRQGTRAATRNDMAE